MIKITSDTYTNIFLFVILPATILSIIILLWITHQKKLSKKKSLFLILKTTSLIFTIDTVYILIWSITELNSIKQFNVLKESRLPIFLWTILPIYPAIMTYLSWHKYKSMKEADQNGQKISSN